MKHNELECIIFQMRTAAGALEKMAILLQSGFQVQVEGAVGIGDFLEGLHGFTRQYIHERVQTIFVNGLAEDDLNRKIQAGDTLALSAAMPGLAGAIFRRGGRHASLRTVVHEEGVAKTVASGYVTVKLFNMIGTEAGTLLLKQGIVLSGKILAKFLDWQKDRLLPSVKRIERNGVSLQIDQLSAEVAEIERVFLKIHSVEEGG